jgi:hypothetical protein
MAVKQTHHLRYRGGITVLLPASPSVPVPAPGSGADWESVGWIPDGCLGCSAGQPGLAGPLSS